MCLLIEVVRYHLRDRHDFFVGGNMFVYHSVEQARDVARGKPYLRGPDVFWVDGVESKEFRDAWLAWEEGGRLPDLIVELMSRSTAKIDRTVKKDLYARIFRTPEYFLCKAKARGLEGFELTGLAYRPITPDGRGWLWSQQLGAFLGLWHGVVEDKEGDWLRLFRADGSLVPTKAEAAEERAEAEHQRAEAERQRADAVEAELTRLRALLAERK